MERRIYILKIRAGFTLLFAFLSLTGIGSTIGQDTPTLKEIVEKETTEQQIMGKKIGKPSRDPLNRTTPRSMLIGITKLLRDGNYEDAVEYFDMRYLPETIKPEDGPRLVRHLQLIFNRNIWLDIAALSDSHEGYLDDGLPIYRDLLGRIETSKGFINLYLQRVPDGKGDYIWKISNATVTQIPELWKEFGYSEFKEQVREALPYFKLLHMENWQWAFLVVFSILSWFVITGIMMLLNVLIRRRSRVYTDVLVRFFSRPFRVFLFIMAIILFIPTLNLSFKARAIFESAILVYIACIWLTLGLVDLICAYYTLRLKNTKREYAVVLVRPISIIIKTFLVTVLVLLGLENAGYDMTTIIAGLGVGSIAVALAAQKTLENVLGAFTLYITRPVKPGDFCRFGTVIGMVEEIGLRSTVIRIPNSTFSGGEIENFSNRDRFRYIRTVRLRLDTTTDQLRYLLVELRKLLYAHPMTYNEGVRVRFTDVDEYSIVLRVEAYLKTDDFSVHLELAEDLNLRLIDKVRDAGTWFAMPSQTIKIEQDEKSDGKRRAEIESIVAQWRKEDQLPFPELGNEEIGKLEDSLDYPPKGSPQAKKE
jgi:MscS family membrane protein